MAEKQVISTLNSLIETCRDGEQGFREAAQSVKDPQVKSLFTEFASERAKFAQELTGEVQRLGGSPDEGGSASGAMHRGWMNIKEAVTGHDDKAIISEAERGEDVAMETYRKALREPLPPAVESVVSRQFEQVRDAHDRVRELEVRYER